MKTMPLMNFKTKSEVTAVKEMMNPSDINKFYIKYVTLLTC
jgi:hypothetical protein